MKYFLNNIRLCIYIYIYDVCSESVEFRSSDQKNFCSMSNLTWSIIICFTYILYIDRLLRVHMIVLLFPDHAIAQITFSLFLTQS